MLLIVSTPIICWFCLSDVTCGDLWDLQFIVRKRTKLLPVSYKGNLEQTFTCVSIVCLSISSDHVLERRLLYKQIFSWRWNETVQCRLFLAKLMAIRWKSISILYRSHKSMVLNSVVSHLNPVYYCTSFFPKICFNVILPTTPKTHTWSHCLGVSRLSLCIQFLFLHLPISLSLSRLFIRVGQFPLIICWSLQIMNFNKLLCKF
jgi:hypothetical protein